ncbi:Uu.00g047710.m01.CDS01 [Anthostomella pinea]|uniref:Uu.00g047710.m01.CDS01 n=1 Tax=Anthostomella pinea TaxID=933095 RepID=A0AAI8YER7_9PEZI|nr:Uu.00g047710.m01.CDS01 [Anthostomella pinea]
MNKTRVSHFPPAKPPPLHDKIHAEVAFDYGGFGLLNGSPTEEGLLIKNAQAVFQRATEVVGIPPERIVVFGQSMGLGVALSLVRELALQEASVAGLVISGSFPDVPTMLAEYRTIFGLRVLGPFARFPSLLALVAKAMRNKWPNRDRLVDIVQQSPRYHI